MMPTIVTSTSRYLIAPSSSRPRELGVGTGQQVARQQTALLEVMREDLLAKDEADVLRSLTEKTAHTLDVDRVSVWLLSDDGSELRLQDLFDRARGLHESDGALESAQYPAYFRALSESRVLSVVDARRDPRTLDFLEPYLIPNRIVSMLDAGIWQAGARRGVVCVESVEVRRDWTPDEQLFVASIADFVAVAREKRALADAEHALSASRRRLNEVFKLSPDPMVLTRAADGEILDVNESFSVDTGFSAEDAIGETTVSLGIWFSSEQRDKWLLELRTNRSVRGMEVEFRMRNGDLRTYQVSSQLTSDPEPTVISTCRDLTSSRRRARLIHDIAQGLAAETGASFFRSLVEHLQRALDADLAFVGSLASANADVVNTIAVHARAGAEAPLTYELEGSPCATVLSEGVSAFPSRAKTLFPRDGLLKQYDVEGYVGAPLISSSGEPLGLIVVMFKQPLEQTDTAMQLMRIFATRAAAELERRDQIDELAFRATHDLLTRLPNRARLEERIDMSLRQSDLTSRGALVLIDLDRFKEINDTLGHRVGDRLIQSVAERLQHAPALLERPRFDLARTGGDEFAIWLPDLPSDDAAMHIVTAVRERITEPVALDGYRLEIGASVGVALYPAHGEGASRLLRCAEIAMYQAKQRGSALCVYDRANDPYSTVRLTLMAEISTAVRERQLVVYFQPQRWLSDGKLAGFEALVRWRHPTRGLLGPGEFIPLAELSDVIRPLTWEVLDQALAQLSRWQNHSSALQMSVNLSARNLMDPHCAARVAELIVKHRVEPSRLELEITESALIKDPDRAEATLRELHESGVRIAIDDFGTGYSSLSHLRRLPLDALKIDVSFVTHMLHNAQDEAIVTSTIGLAHSLGLTVIAEGIEDAATQERLRTLGCELGQGFHISVPLPADDADRWISSAT
jgi:diguanylate cyclase (GGDEF)-like protein/PAS domain S-box-containing protein